MKTSNRLFLAVALIIVVYMVGYDFALKAEYDKGAYKSRFYKMHQLKLGSFNNIQHNAGDMLGMRVEQGAQYGVWIDNELKDKIKVGKNGQTLTIDYINQKDEYSWGRNDAIIITCPLLNSIKVNPVTRSKEDKESGYDREGNLEIAGFKQTAAMNIEAEPFINITLINNNLSTLNARVGKMAKDKARLTIQDSNHIKLANLQINGYSQLSLYNPVIEQPKYTLSDSAMVTLNGNALHLIRQ